MHTQYQQGLAFQVVEWAMVCTTILLLLASHSWQMQPVPLVPLGLTLPNRAHSASWLHATGDLYGC